MKHQSYGALYTQAATGSAAATVEMVTPALASEWLKKNTRNRSASLNWVRTLARDMKEGRFREDTGEPIKFFADGVLADGQHRLLAIIESNTAFRFLVVRNLSLATAGFLDKGRKRTVGDDLAIAGYSNANVLASFVPHLAVIARKAWSVRLSASEVREVIEAHPGLQGLAAGGALKGLGGLRSITGAIVYVGQYLGRVEEAQMFLRVMTTGEPSSGLLCPAHQFRERFIREKMRGVTQDTPLTLKLGCKAFNMLCSGQYKALVAPQHPEIPGWDEKTLFLRDTAQQGGRA